MLAYAPPPRHHAITSSMDLPPPPAKPELPPEVHLPGEGSLLFRTDDDLAIEGLGLLPPSAQRVVVICHPHPLYGGTMHNALVLVVAKRLLERGQGRIGWLRFNFRGVGHSEGAYGAGTGEVADARAAIREVRQHVHRRPVSVVGISFGTGPGYAAAVNEGGVDRVSLVTPSPRVMRIELGEYRGLVQVVAAGKDELCTPEETEQLAKRLGAEVASIPEADHQFKRFRRDVAGLVVPFAAPEI
ncbi:MAG TPA: hypothetical protein VJT73_10060 [Polyangiaceae bacterium]|nr:hypothetical protein [Polyangiaceae bacterium]